MPPKRLVRSAALAGAAVIFALSAVSCQEPDYRNQVTANGQGGVTIERVPKPPEEITQEAAAAERAKPVDPDLAAVEANWANLSPADRRTVVDLVQRLAAK